MVRSGNSTDFNVSELFTDVQQQRGGAGQNPPSQIWIKISGIIEKDKAEV